MKYTHSVTFYKKISGLGWQFCSFKTTEDALKGHLKLLGRRQAKGSIRMLDAIKLQDTNEQGESQTNK